MVGLDVLKVFFNLNNSVILCMCVHTVYYIFVFIRVFCTCCYHSTTHAQYFLHMFLRSVVLMDVNEDETWLVGFSSKCSYSW